MTVKKITCITLACNDCGTDLEGDGFVQHFGDAVDALDSAEGQDWIGDAETGDAWCPNCKSLVSDDDEDA